MEGYIYNYGRIWESFLWIKIRVDPVGSEIMNKMDYQEGQPTRVWSSRELQSTAIEPMQEDAEIITSGFSPELS